jgi:hypothetical protein
VPAGALPLNFEKMWELISSQKDLDLPAHKVMVASVRCNQISEEHAAALQSDQAWMALHSESEAGKVVMDFKTRATDLISSCVYGYASVPSAASSCSEWLPRIEFGRPAAAELGRIPLRSTCHSTLVAALFAHLRRAKQSDLLTQQCCSDLLTPLRSAAALLCLQLALLCSARLGKQGSDQSAVKEIRHMQKEC